MPDQTRKQTRKEKVVLPLLFTDTRKSTRNFIETQYTSETYSKNCTFKIL